MPSYILAKGIRKPIDTIFTNFYNSVNAFRGSRASRKPVMAKIISTKMNVFVQDMAIMEKCQTNQIYSAYVDYICPLTH